MPRSLAAHPVKQMHRHSSEHLRQEWQMRAQGLSTSAANDDQLRYILFRSGPNYEEAT
jgi:hypothetical protein